MDADLLNGVCPYFTMFPLAFPRAILRQLSRPGEAVFDPFCGRGTTVHAGHRLGRPAIGFDSHPVAVAITAGKLCPATPADIVAAAQDCLRQVPRAREIPRGEFWSAAYERRVLATLCRLRVALLADARSGARPALRALLLGALHGPRARSALPSYFSNQCPRTFAPKPAYALKFWDRHQLTPPRANVMALIGRRAERFYREAPAALAGSRALLVDSRRPEAFRELSCRAGAPVRWIITSPPYYGMRTYRPDQWLRLWFLGGPPTVDYANDAAGQLAHGSPAEFASQLRTVWRHCALAGDIRTRLVVRFGAINDRRVDACELLKSSFRGTPWRVDTIAKGGSAASGRRQALHFGREPRAAIVEHDFWLSR